MTQVKQPKSRSLDPMTAVEAMFANGLIVEVRMFATMDRGYSLQMHTTHLSANRMLDRKSATASILTYEEQIATLLWEMHDELQAATDAQE